MNSFSAANVYRLEPAGIPKRINHITIDLVWKLVTGFTMTDLQFRKIDLNHTRWIFAIPGHDVIGNNVAATAAVVAAAAAAKEYIQHQVTVWSSLHDWNLNKVDHYVGLFGRSNLFKKIYCSWLYKDAVYH